MRSARFLEFPPRRAQRVPAVRADWEIQRLTCTASVPEPFFRTEALQHPAHLWRSLPRFRSARFSSAFGSPSSFKEEEDVQRRPSCPPPTKVHILGVETGSNCRGIDKRY